MEFQPWLWAICGVVAVAPGSLAVDDGIPMLRQDAGRAQTESWPSIPREAGGMRNLNFCAGRSTSSSARS